LDIRGPLKFSGRLVCPNCPDTSNSELDSNFVSSKLDSCNLSQGDSEGVSVTARSYDLASPDVVPPVVDSLTAVLFIFTQLQI